jgi:hypothetical protein
MKFELKSGFILTPGSYPWILDIPCWLLDILPPAVPGFRLFPLDIGHSVLVIGYFSPAVPGFRLFPLDIGYSVLVIGYSSPAVPGFRLFPLDIGYSCLE